MSFEDAREKIENWRGDYNGEVPYRDRLQAAVSLVKHDDEPSFFIE
jgi:hypothetical protein